MRVIKLFIVLTSFVLCLSVQAYAVTPKMPVPPGCIYAMMAKPHQSDKNVWLIINTSNVKIAACKNNKIPKFKKPNFFKYKYLGYVAPYHYVSTAIERDGQWSVSGIASFKIKNGEMLAHDLFFGSFCNNGLADAKVDKTGITMGINYTPWDVINYMLSVRPYFTIPYGSRKYDILQSPGLCDGVMHWHFAKDTEEPTPLFFTFKPNYDFQDPNNPQNPKGIHYSRDTYGKLQDCYFKLVQPYEKKIQNAESDAAA